MIALDGRPRMLRLTRIDDGSRPVLRERQLLARHVLQAEQTTSYRPGELRRFWPRIIEPEGRIYFAGAYCDNLNWG